MAFYKTSIMYLIAILLIMGLPIPIAFVDKISALEGPIAKPNNYLYPILSKDIEVNDANELRVIEDCDGDGFPEAIIVNNTHLIVYYSSSNPVIVFTGLPPLFMDNLSHFFVLDNLLFLVSSFSNNLRLTIIDLINRSIIINTDVNRPFIGLGVHGFIKEDNVYTIYVRIFDPFRFKEGILPIKFINNGLNESYILIEDPYYPVGVELTYNVINGFSNNSSAIITYNIDMPINIFYTNNESFTISSTNWSIYFNEKYVSITIYNNDLLLISKLSSNYYLRVIDLFNGSILYSKYIPVFIGDHVFTYYYIFHDQLSALYRGVSSYKIYYYRLPDLVFQDYIEFSDTVTPLAPLIDIDSDGLQEYLVIDRNYLGIIYTTNKSTEMIKWIPSTYIFDYRGIFTYTNQTYIYIIMNYMGKETLFLLKLDTMRKLDDTPPNVLINSPTGNILRSPIVVNVTIDDDIQIYSLEVYVSDNLGNLVFHEKIYNCTYIVYTIDLRPGHYVLNVSAVNIDGLHTYATHEFAIVEEENPPTQPLIIISSPRNWSIISRNNFNLSLIVIYPEPVELYVYINDTYVSSLYGNNSLLISIDLSNKPDGIYLVTINASKVYAKLYIIKDLLPPSLYIISPSNETIIDQVFNLTFTVLDTFLDKISIYIDGIRLYHIETPNEGIFSIEINPWNYESGRHIITIIASDIAGHRISKTLVLYFNTSLKNIHVDIKVNTTNASYVLGLLEVNITCYQDLMGIIRLTNIGSQETYIVNQWSGNTSYLLDTSLYTDGVYKLSIDITSPNGSYTTIWHMIIYIDNNAPKITVQVPWDISTYRDLIPITYLNEYKEYYKILNISVTIDEPFLRDARVRVDDKWYDIRDLAIKSWNLSNGFKALLAIPISSSWDNNITFYAVDMAGHNSSIVITLYLDLDPPVVSGVEDMIYSRTGIVNLTVKAYDLAGIANAYIIVNGTKYMLTINHTLSLNLDDGIWKGYIIVEDIVGNVFNKSITIVVDNNAPSIEVEYELLNTSMGYELELSVHIEDNVSGLYRVDIFINGVKIFEKTYSSEKEDNIFFRKILEFRHDLEIIIKACDNLGNIGNYTYYIELVETKTQPNTEPLVPKPSMIPIIVSAIVIIALATLATIYWRTKTRKTSTQK